MSLMVLGTSSHAGKSSITAGICRILSDRGIPVAPFKAQNMSLNSKVTRSGSEIAMIQTLQATAAGLKNPDAHMNPILLKPKGDTVSQVMVLGQPYGTIAFYEFTSGEGCWVLDGLGHQWNTTAGNISRMMILLATSGNSTSSWLMEGYAQSEKANQNWLKFVSQNATKTRTVRCIKTPVEYIYE